MKKVILLTAMICLAVVGGFANNASLFELDEQAIENQFADLSELESIILANEGVTLSGIQNGELNLSPELNAKVKGLSDGMNLMEPPLGIPGFWWGCVLGPLGILLAYLLSDQDRDETKSALWGCLIVQGGLFLIYVIIWVLVLGSGFLFF